MDDFIDIGQEEYLRNPQMHLPRLWEHFRESETARWATPPYQAGAFVLCIGKVTFKASSPLKVVISSTFYLSSPRNLLIFPYSSLLRPLGMNTKWYLQSHLEWLRLSN